MQPHKMPTWLKVLLGVAAVIVLGPPALALIAMTLGIAISLAALTLKVGVAVAIVYAVYLLFRAVFGGDRTPSAPQPSSSSIETIEHTVEAEELARREELDRQLDEAIRATR